MKVLFRADAYVAIGAGHFVRCFALAQTLREWGVEVHWAAAELGSAHAVWLAQEGIFLHRIGAVVGSSQDAELTKAVADTMDAAWVVADGYEFSPAYQSALYRRLLYLDDYSHLAAYPSDVLLNQNIYANPGMYDGKIRPENIQLLGPSFCLLRNEFKPFRDWSRPVAAELGRIYVSMGGADPENVSLLILQGLNRLERRLEVDIVLGTYSPHQELVRDAADHSHHKVNVLINPPDIPQLMSEADLAFCAGGSTSWELAFMELPSITVWFAENQRMLAEGCDEAGLTVNLGLASGVDVRAVEEAVRRLLDPDLRGKMATQGREVVDGFGAERVAEALL